MRGCRQVKEVAALLHCDVLVLERKHIRQQLCDTGRLAKQEARVASVRGRLANQAPENAGCFRLCIRAYVFLREKNRAEV